MKNSSQATVDFTPLREEISAASHHGKNLGERIAAVVESRILSGSLRAGAKLPAATIIASMLAVSPTAVRDAVNVLQARGLITVRQGHGMSVAAPTDQVGETLMSAIMRDDTITLRDLGESRALLETQLAHTVITNSAHEDWAALEAHLSEMHSAVLADDLNAALDSHVLFHRAYLLAAHMPVLDILLSPLQQISLLCSLPSMTDPEQWDIEGHRAIIDALRSRDEAELISVLSGHYRDLRDPRFREYYAQTLHDMPLAHTVLAELRRRPGSTSESASRVLHSLSSPIRHAPAEGFDGMSVSHTTE